VFPGAGEVEVRSEGGRVTLTGRVQHKKLKRDIGEIAWATAGVNDVQNNLTITGRRRARGAGREQEQPSGARKPA
jgi:BON domain